MVTGILIKDGSCWVTKWPASIVLAGLVVTNFLDDEQPENSKLRAQMEINRYFMDGVGITVQT